MTTKKSTPFLKGALILTIAGFIVKILSALYRGPFQNIVGDVGFYIYQQVYPIYGIAAVLSVSGFPMIISRVVSVEKESKKEYFMQTLAATFYTLLAIGGFFFLLFFFGAGTLSKWMGDPYLAPLIQMSSFMFLLLPFTALIRGYFQGIGNMAPTANSQVVEQIIRVSVILMVAGLYLKQGGSLYSVGQKAVFGSILGGLCGFTILFFYLQRSKLHFFFFFKKITFKKFYRTAQIIFIHGIIACLSSMILLLFQLVDSFTLYSLLVRSGVPMEEAKVLKGVFDRGQPLLQVGTVVASSISLALIPHIASSWQNGEITIVKENIEKALNITMVIGLGAAIGLMNIIQPTNMMLFADYSGSGVLAVLSLAIFFTSLILISSSILQSMGEIRSIGTYVFIGCMIKVVGNILVVPLLSTFGSALSTIISLAVTSLLFLYTLNQKIHISSFIRQKLIKIMISAVGMTVVLQSWLLIFSHIHGSRSFSMFLALSSVVLGVFVYLILNIKLNTFSDEEIKMLPLGGKIIEKFIRK